MLVVTRPIVQVDVSHSESRGTTDTQLDSWIYFAGALLKNTKVARKTHVGDGGSCVENTICWLVFRSKSKKGQDPDEKRNRRETQFME